MSSQALEIQSPRAETSVVTPMTMIDRAIEMKADPATLERLFALQERWEANQARKAFDEAMAAAKSEIPVIAKNRLVSYEAKNQTTSYRHEDMAEIARTVDPILSKHGLSYRFRTSSEVNAPVSVTCVITHRLGHSEENTLHAGRDNSGSKNDIQAIGSTLSYLQRYTLKAALGLASAHDDDGMASSGVMADDELISKEEADELEHLATEAQANIPKLCEFLGVATLDDLRRRDYTRALGAIEAKRRKAGK